MVSQVITATVVGIDSYKILVEVDLVQSIPSVVIVGLPDTAVSEAKERVRTAIKNSGFVFPNQKVIINLAPADIKKKAPTTICRLLSEYLHVTVLWTKKKSKIQPF